MKSKSIVVTVWKNFKEINPNNKQLTKHKKNYKERSNLN